MGPQNCASVTQNRVKKCLGIFRGGLPGQAGPSHSTHSHTTNIAMLQPPSVLSLSFDWSVQRPCPNETFQTDFVAQSTKATSNAPVHQTLIRAKGSREAALQDDKTIITNRGLDMTGRVEARKNDHDGTQLKLLYKA